MCVCVFYVLLMELIGPFHGLILTRSRTQFFYPVATFVGTFAYTERLCIFRLAYTVRINCRGALALHIVAIAQVLGLPFFPLLPCCLAYG